MNNSYQINKLSKNDYHKGFLELLEQLTEVNPDSISYEMFCEHLDSITSDIYVIKNISKNVIVASGSLLIEKKFIHGLSSVGHIEDIVVDCDYRGMGFGKQIVDYLVNKAKINGCYKVILDCSEQNVEFYKKCGFDEKGIEMTIYF